MSCFCPSEGSRLTWMEETRPWPCGLLRLCWENSQPLCPQWSSRDPFAFLPETMKLQITLCDPGLEAARGTEGGEESEGEGVVERLQAAVQGGATGAQLGRPSGEETELE